MGRSAKTCSLATPATLPYTTPLVGDVSKGALKFSGGDDTGIYSNLCNTWISAFLFSFLGKADQALLRRLEDKVQYLPCQLASSCWLPHS